MTLDCAVPASGAVTASNGNESRRQYRPTTTCDPPRMRIQEVIRSVACGTHGGHCKSLADGDRQPRQCVMNSTLDLDQARYAAIRLITPPSVDHPDLLVDRLELEPGADVLDLGCGWGELLPRAVEASGQGSTGVGIDTDEQGLARGRVPATAQGLDGRVQFVNAESATWDQPADRVLCIGASHA